MAMTMTLLSRNMSKLAIAIIIFFLPYHCVTSVENSLCAAVCECERSETGELIKLDCSRVLFSIVPPIDDWPRHVIHLDLSSNNISVLDTELSHPTLEVLDLSYNRITKVVQNAFGGLKNLKYLNLANNIIKHFDENGFYGLEHLKSLNLSSNGLSELQDSLLYNFLYLEELSLADNPLQHLDPIHLNRMIGLKWLDISNTYLYSLPPNIFHTTGKLEFLDLSGNDFYEVPTDALRSANSLRHLRLNENKMETLNKKSFIKLSTLKVLELNNLAHLTQVEEKTFSGLTNLTILEMKFNHHLASISPLAFEGLFTSARAVLEEVDMEGNNLSVIDKDTADCAKLRKFNVQKNPWVCDCNLKWIKECHIQKIYAADLKCTYPEKLENALIYSLSESDFVCDYKRSQADVAELHHQNVVKSISLIIGIAVLMVLALSVAVVFKWRDIKSWYRFRSRGPGAVYYVRARSNPTSNINPS